MLKISLVTLGHLKYSLKVKELTEWKSNLLKITQNAQLNHLQDPEGNDQEYLDTQLFELIQADQEADFTVALIGAPLENNYYMRCISEKICVISLFQMAEIVRDANFTLVPLYEDYGVLIFQGILNTLYVSFIALIGSLILGFIMYLMAISKSYFFRALVDVFTEIIYGTPLLVMIILMAFLIGPAFGNFNRAFLGTVGLILYISPYMKNVFQSSSSITTPVKLGK